MNLSKTDREPHRYLIMWDHKQLLAINDLTVVEQHRLCEVLIHGRPLSSIQIRLNSAVQTASRNQSAELYLVDSQLTEEEIEKSFSEDFSGTVLKIKQEGEFMYSYKEKEKC